MKIYKGNVGITKVNQKEWEEKLKDVEKISGNLSVYSNAKLDALKSVGGDIWVYSDARLDALKSVGGSLWVYSDARLDALKSVGGYLSVYSNAKLDAGKLESVGGDIEINKTAKVSENIIVLQVAKVL